MLSELVAQYGYAAVLLGSLLEGETILLLAGIAANRGYLSYPVVVALAFVGGTLGDQILFQLGRRYGLSLLARAPTLASRTAKVDRLIERHQNAVIVGVRFLYGLRLVGPFVIGTSNVSTQRFLILNMIGAAIWAPLIVGIGYFFGQTLAWLLEDLGHYEAAGLVGVIVIGVGIYFIRSHLKGRAPPAGPA